jgi:propanol-preferring alcohol dehydrogenase
MVETLAFAVAGKVNADIELQPLSAIDDIFDRLAHGKVAGRVALDFVGAKVNAHPSKPWQQKEETGAAA